MNPSEPQESIAIVGMAGRFPKAGNLAEFWRNLRDGVEGVTFFRDEQVEWLPIESAPDLRDPGFVRARAVLERPEWFDAGFFGINPQEARVMDPQHRVFLECCWEALEHAGCDPETAAGMIGVFAGASLNTYLFTNLLTNRDLVARLGVFPTLLGNDGDFLPTRVSYKLNLRGPSLNVQTACSTSLVAVCLAAQSLLSYRCDLALAGGVSITFPQQRGQQYLEGGILSPDGHCRAFDARAGGTVLGDGAGVVVLKRLSEAIADGDAIAAVIKGTAVNNDGALKIGYTAPAAEGQAEAIALAHAEAGFAPETVDYVEAHGTGTPIGDPIEIAGLTKAFGLGGEQGQFCALGSVKTNIGHLDVGAGVAGLIKTVLALQHEAIPPSLHFESPNPKIDFAHSPFFVNRTLRPWPRTGRRPRRAGVSSFGIGGTNAHVALEEAPAPLPTTPVAGPHLLLLSAKTPRALAAAAENLARHLEAHPDTDLADVAFTLQVGRKAFPHRRAIVCHDLPEAVRALRDPAAGMRRAHAGAGEPPRIAFLFPGQGAQKVDMARGLYDSDPGFRAQVDRSCELLQPRLGLDLRTVLFPATAAEAEAAPARLAETWLTQPALFVIEHALAERWRQWGIEPDAMLGHSLGEYVAACLAGVFSLADALAVVAERGRLMQAQPAGAMLAVRAPEEKVAAWLDTNLALAAVNAPGLCVVSGPFDAIDALERRLTAGAIAFKRLATSHAFHSAMMEPALGPFAEFLRGVRLQPPQRRWISNVTGTWITAGQATDPAYWVAQLRGTVRFSAGLGQLLAGGAGVLLEVGPGRTLNGLARQHPAGATPPVAVASLGGSPDAESDRAAQSAALGELWLAGAAVAWRSGVYRGQRRRIVPLPTYPFERERCWIEPGHAWEPGGAAPVPAGVSETSLQSGAAADRAPAPRSPAAPTMAPGPAAGGRNGHGTAATLKALFAELSGSDLSAARPDATFYELGFDSLFLTQCTTEVGRRLGVEVSIRKLREELTTFEQLGAYVDRQSGRPAPAGVRPAADAGRVAPGAAGGGSRVASTGAPDPAPEAPPAGPPAAEDPASPRRVPVTDIQREIWQAVQAGPAVACSYHEAATLHLRGRLDDGALLRALRQLALRHEALRISFSAGGEEQWIAADAGVELARHDFSAQEPEVRNARMAEFIAGHRQRPLDPVCGPLWRAALLRVEPDHHVLSVVVHQLICDADSLGRLLRDWGALYTAETAGRPAALPPAGSFAAAGAARAGPGAESRRAAGDSINGFATGVAPLELPADRPRPASPAPAGATVVHSLGADLGPALQRFCAEQACTPFAMLFATASVLLHRLSGQEEVVIGVPCLPPVPDGTTRPVGPLARIVPVRGRVDAAQGFAELLAICRQNLAGAQEHGHRPPASPAAQPMPRVSVAVGPTGHPGALSFGELAVEPAISPRPFVPFDLSLLWETAPDGPVLACCYRTELFAAATIERWCGHFETLLRAAVAAPAARVGTLPLLGATERRRITQEWNETRLEYPRNECVQDPFFALAVAEPHLTALVLDDRKLTYGELARRAEALANDLRRQGVGPDVPVGICVDRSFEMVIAVLGVLRAGGAFVPLDPAETPERLTRRITAARLPVVLTQRHHRDRLAGNPAVAIRTVDAASDAPLPPLNVRPLRLVRGNGAEHLACVLFTAGSPERSKPVAMPHRPLRNLVAWQVRESRVGKGGRTLQFAALGCDMAVQEIFATLSTGGVLVLAPEVGRCDGRALWRLIERQRVERLFLPFVGLEKLAGAFAPAPAGSLMLQEVISADDTLRITPTIAAMFSALDHCTLQNQYGTTETHVVTAHRITGAPRRWPVRPPIGRPISNVQVLVLEPGGQPAPIGVPGELWVGGDGLARGYLHRPELTVERFGPSPVADTAPRWYRTGDLVRWDADGNLEFVGRVDRQVKLHGHRCELSEIEAALRQHRAVSTCAVLLREDEPGCSRLTAYFTAAGSEVPSAGDLRRYLEERLPEYMLPAVFVALPRLPLTAAGKLDRRALPAPAGGEHSRDSGPRPTSLLVDQPLQLPGHAAPARSADPAEGKISQPLA